MLDIILPCYNPHEEWEENIVKRYNEIKQSIGDGIIHLYIVNDGSDRGITGKSIDYIRGHIPDFHYLTYANNKGKGYALRYAIYHSSSDYVIYTDIDFPYQQDSFLTVYNELVSNRADIVVGVRTEKYYKDLPYFRAYISKCLRWLLKMFLGLTITDTQCGLKGFNQKGKEVFLQTKIKRYLFDLEFLYRAESRKDIKIAAVVASLRPGIYFRKMNAKILLVEAFNFLRIFFQKR